MLTYNTEEIFKELSCGKYILVVGAGKYGRFFLTRYIEEKERIIVLDNDRNKQEEGITILGIDFEVRPLDTIGNYCDTDSIIVIAIKNYMDIYSDIEKNYNGNIPIFIFPFTESRKIQFEKLSKKCLEELYLYKGASLQEAKYVAENEFRDQVDSDFFIIPYLPIYLTTRCTLCCEKCNNLMPYLKNRQDFELSEIKRTVNKIIGCVDGITFCELVGGEPFLYPELKEIIEYIGAIKKVKQIIIVSNGTIIPDESVLMTIKKYNAIVRLSDYGIINKISQVEDYFEHYGIKAVVLKDMKWRDAGGIQKRNRTKEELSLQFNRCMYSLKCKYLMLDKLYNCARMASLDLLGISMNETDVLNIDEAITKDKIKEFYYGLGGCGCDYCDMWSIYGGKEIPAAEQV